MRILLTALMMFALVACARQTLDEVDARWVGIQLDGLQYSTESFELNNVGGSGYTVTPDGSIYAGQKRVAKSKALWSQIVDLTERYSGVEYKSYTKLEKNPASPLLHLAAMTTQSLPGPNECMSHWTNIELKVKVGEKRAIYEVGECLRDYRSDKAGREIYTLFREYLISHNLRAE